MENVDPLGIHTGESIVVAPSQTLSNTGKFPMCDLGISFNFNTNNIVKHWCAQSIIIYLFIYLFVCLFACLFVCLFIITFLIC